MGAKPVVEFRNVEKCFDIGRNVFLKRYLLDFFKRGKSNRFTALDDVSFRINKGECVGLWGRNGSGKSTVLRLIAGLYRPDSGSVVVRESVASVLELGVGLHPELTGRDNIMFYSTILGISKDKLKDNFESIVNFFGFHKFIDTPVKKYSTGMKSRLAFSIAVYSEADILLLDEVLSVGDSDFRERALKKVSDLKGEKTIVFTAHSYTIMQQLCDRMITLRDGKIVKRSSLKGLRFFRGLEDGVEIKAEASSSSMEPVIKKGDLITIRGVPYKKLREGDIVAFIFSNLDEIIVHRVVVRKKMMSGSVKCYTKGDYSYEVDPWLLTEHEYIGKVVGIKSMGLGSF